MAFDFPSAPTVGTIYAPAGGPSYVWDGVAWKVAAGSNTVPRTALPKNLILNPSFDVDQEAAGIVTAHNTYFCDGWKSSFSNGGTMRYERVPSSGGYARSLGRFFVTAADASIAASDYASIYHALEGLQLADLRWGSVAAKPAVLRFNAYASAAGTYCVAVRDNSIAAGIVFNFTLAAATWAEFSFAIPPCTTGTWTADTAQRGAVVFTYACGTSYQTAPGVWTAGNVLATSSISNGIGVTNNDFYVTNVGLYVDPDGTGLAPPYEAPNYSDELARCQRYYHKNVSEGNGWVFSAIGFDATARSFYGMLYYPVEMRASPSITLSGLNYGNASGAVVNGTPAVKSFRMNAASVGAGSCYAAGYYTANARM